MLSRVRGHGSTAQTVTSQSAITKIKINKAIILLDFLKFERDLIAFFEFLKFYKSKRKFIEVFEVLFVLNCKIKI